MKIYLVGGAVRDRLLHLPVKEKDWVVVGAQPDELTRLGYRQVGKEFPVFLHPKTNEEYALARMERKVGPGYKGFTFDTSPHVTLEEDLLRRDLTINAMAEDSEGKVIDPYHGQEDLKNKLLRHVSPAFAEDPVRILRIARFAARYAALGFTIAPETMELMRAMVNSGEVDSLVAERVWKEYERALSEKNPEVFFAVLAECGALSKLFPHFKVSGRGMQALNAAVRITADPSIRCASAWHALPEDGANIEPKICIQKMCERYRAPVLFRDLAILTAVYHEKTLHCQTLSPEKLLDLLLKLDAFRREERFKQFLRACEAIAQSRSIPFNGEWLHAIFKIAQAIDTKAIQASGVTGPNFAVEINRLRLKAIGEKLHDERS